MARPGIRRTAALAALSLALLPACGGSGDADDATGPDRRAITAVSSELEKAIEDQDAAAFCGLLQPNLVRETFGGPRGCVKQVSRGLPSAGRLDSLEVEKITVQGDGAIVNYTANPPGQILFVRENGRWYVSQIADGDPGGGDGTTPSG